MKISTVLMLGALCGCSPCALAQLSANPQSPTPGLQFPPRAIPFQVLPDGMARPDSELPALPQLDPGSRARTEIRLLLTRDGEIYQAEIVRQSVGEVLQTLAAAAGVPVVVDPQLKQKTILTAVFRGRTPQELLENFGKSQAEMWQSALGTYFFAEKARARAANPYLKNAPSGVPIVPQNPDFRVVPVPNPDDIYTDPFVRPGRPLSPDAPQIDPDFNFGKPSFGPPPGAEKREFNGRHYYEMPLPKLMPQSVDPPLAWGSVWVESKIEEWTISNFILNCWG